MKIRRAYPFQRGDVVRAKGSKAPGVVHWTVRVVVDGVRTRRVLVGFPGYEQYIDECNLKGATES